MSAPSLTAFAQGQGVVNANWLNGVEQTCDNVSQLRAFTGIIGNQVFMRGFSVPNDGGQGPFYWNPTATAIDDGVNVIRPTGVSVGAWIRIVIGASLTNTLAWMYEGDNPPLNSGFLAGFCVPFLTSFPANMAGSNFHVQSAFLPTSTYVISIQLNDVQVATLTVNTNGSYAYAGSAWSAQINDRVTILGAASADATINRFFGTLVGTIG